MNRRLLLLGFLLVVIANAVILSRVGYNRSGVVNSIQFSERELPVYYSRSRENSGVAAQLRWQTPAQADDNFYYGFRRELQLSDTQLAALGFPPRNCDGQRDYNNVREERKAWVLMELNGTAYQNALTLAEARWHDAQENGDDKQTRRKGELRQLRYESSRLYAIAVAAAPETLLAAVRDPDKQFLVRAVVQQGYSCENTVWIKQLFIEHLHISRERLAGFDRLPMHYQVEVAIGQLGEAWVERIVPAPDK